MKPGSDKILKDLQKIRQDIEQQPDAYTRDAAARVDQAIHKVEEHQAPTEVEITTPADPVRRFKDLRTGQVRTEPR